jgi:hypothetical protein
MEKQLQHWGAKLDELVANAKEADKEADIDYHHRVDELKAKYHVAQAKLEELRDVGGDKWDTIKTGFESAWYELEVAFKKLSN